MIDKSQMTEEEIKLNYITPAILEKWSRQAFVWSTILQVVVLPLMERKQFVVRLIRRIICFTMGT